MFSGLAFETEAGSGVRRSLSIAFATWSLVAIFHFVSSAIATMPLICDLRWWNNGADLLLYSWIFGWDWHALTTNPLGLFNANIFYPAHHSLSTSDHRLGQLILWAVPWLITHKRLLSDGVALYLTYALTGIGLHIWIRYWTGDHVSAGLAAALINLNPLRIYNAGAVHVIGVMWMPLALVGMDRYLVKGGRRGWLLMVAMFWMQFQVSFYLAYGILLLMGAYFILALWLRPVSNARRAWLGILLGCVVLFATLAPFVIPYIERTSAFYDPNKLLESSPCFPSDYFLCYGRNFLWGQVIGMGEIPEGRYPLWMGLFIPLAGIAGAYSGLRSGRKSPVFRATLLLILLSVFMFALSLGPYLKLSSGITGLPLPFLLFMKTAPGFKNMHMPYRFLNTTVVIWAPLAGIGIARILEKAGGASKKPNIRRLSAMFLIAAFLALDIWCFPWERTILYPAEDARPVTVWLEKNNVKGGIIELPFTREQFVNNTLYMFQSLHHYRPIANGYGSFFPPEFIDVDMCAASLPDYRALQGLADMGIRTYVLHLDMLDFYRMVDTDSKVDRKTLLSLYPKLENFLGVDDRTVEAFSSSSHLTELARFPKDIVYEFKESSEYTSRLEGTVLRIVPSQPASLIMYIGFIGEGGRIWQDPINQLKKEIKVVLSPLDAGGSAVEPMSYALSLPSTISPEEGYIEDFAITRLPQPGNYRLEVVSEDPRITIYPITIDVR